MKLQSETNLLFDDLATLKATLGNEYMKNVSANSDNDCSNYTYTADDEQELNTAKGTGAAL